MPRAGFLRVCAKRRHALSVSSHGALLCYTWEMNPKLRKVVITVAVLNLAYFAVEFAVALMIGSVSLFADSVDFLKTPRSIF